MKNDVVAHFDKDRAATYDEQWKPLAPMMEALHLLTRIAFSALPERASILCVGAGTGTEILRLAEAYPRWRFAAVEPAEAMMEVCRQRLETAGLSDRCDFHQSYLETLPPGPAFDAATCFLVSHFLTDAAARGAFFASIAERLSAGGLLVSADLAADRKDPAFDRLMALWLDLIAAAGMPLENRIRYREMFGVEVAAQSPQEVEALIAENGFEAPTQIYQSVLIRAWLSRRAG